MSSPRITFNFSSRAVDDPWWVRLEQEDLPDDTATVSDAADLLDTLYNLDACDDSTTEAVDDVSADEVTTTVEATVSAVSCLFDADGNVDVVVRVIRSSHDADYRLALVGGLLKTTETVLETVTQQTTLENASSLTLDYPVIEGFAVEWRGQVYGSSGPIDDPKISRVGNTLDFGGVSVKSGTIRAEYLTEYDRCTITILGKDGEPGECVARAFFHGLVDELELQTPDAAEDVGSCTSHWVAPVSDDEVTCFRAVTKSYRCQCTDKEVYRETYDEITECPEYVTRCPGNASDCMHLIESITVPEYVGCSDDAEVTGAPGRIYALSTPEYYRDKCCEDPTGALPQCPERTTSWRGGLPIAGGAAKYYGMYGPKLRIVPVSPPGGICGTWKIKQEIRSNNCCEGVEPLAWDTSVSPEVMPPNSAALIGVTGGGEYPYQWTVAGTGFQFQNGSTKIITTANQVRLSALPLACGVAIITCTDGCSTVRGYIRATIGQWVRVYLNTNGGPPICEFSGHCATDLLSETVTSATYEAIVGPVKIHQVLEVYDANAPAKMTPELAHAACMDGYASLLADRESVVCRGDEHKCSTCFLPESYSPCAQYADFPSYDPQWKTSCSNHVYGYYGPIGSWWYYKVHYSRVGKTEIWEWQC